MVICTAEGRHIPGIIELLKQVGQVHHQGRPDLFRAEAQKYNEEDLQMLLQEENRPIFVAEEEGSVLGYGFCILQRTQNDPVLKDHFTCYVDDLCVDENIRGRGIGKAIYRHIVQYAKGLGCHSVTLNVWSFNEGAAKFYQSLGLKPRKTVLEMGLEEI